MAGNTRPRTPDRILALALQKEQDAHDFYESMADGCPVEFVRELLMKLQNEEARHMRMVREMISRLEAGRDLTEKP